MPDQKPEPQPLPEPTVITRGDGQSVVWRGFDTPTDQKED